MMRLGVTLAIVLTLIAPASAQKKKAPSDRWPAEKANAWHKEQPWLVGCNYIPSTAINQLEMWQADTWDPQTIDRELGWAADLGFTSVRVFLHDLAWKQDRSGFINRMDYFLRTADKHRLRAIFVLFDSCWHPEPKPGKQPAPTPHRHNPGWVQSPGVAVLKDPEKWPHMGAYVRDVLRTFQHHKGILCWDLWNEPENNNASSYGDRDLKDKEKVVLPLVKQ
ncbi:MAG: 1,4-beta-xylanase, partial [Planctomycetes bacterium]|nr:1,4-beta-xylanase [Planctomycetota bacterium]